MAYYTANGKKLKPSSNGYKILRHILIMDGATKYDCLTKALKKEGSKEKLRGYYSHYFRGLVDNGVLTLDKKDHKYHITEHGADVFIQAHHRD